MVVVAVRLSHSAGVEDRKAIFAGNIEVSSVASRVQAVETGDFFFIHDFAGGWVDRRQALVMGEYDALW